MKLFAQIRKVDEEKRLVFGRVAEEVVDKADEVMDYASSKPHFQKWSDDVAKDSGGKSLGNVRAMHGRVSAGVLKGIDFNDAAKAIDVSAHIVDDQEWKKVLAGCYTGFSMGGKYVGDAKVEKMDGRDVKRYTAAPNEVSLVDRPCIPTATFFEVQKADGTLRKVDFAPAPADPVDVQVRGTPEQIAALGKALNTNDLDLADALAMVEKAMPSFIKDKADAKKKKDGKGGDAAAADDKDAKAKDEAGKADEAADLKKVEQAALRKSMYSCSSLAQTIASLQSLQSSAAYEAFSKGDDSGIAQKLKACIAMCGGVLKDMIDAEIADASDPDVIVLALAEKAGALAKFEGDPVVELLKAEGRLAKAGARNSSADKARLGKIHDLSVELGHECAGAAKKDDAGDLAKAEAAKKVADARTALAKVDGIADKSDAEVLELHKAAQAEELRKGEIAKIAAELVAPLQKLIDGQAAEIKLLKAQPAPTTVALRVIAKNEDAGGDANSAAAVDPVKDDDGKVNEAASLIKAAHASGGRPLVRELRK